MIAFKHLPSSQKGSIDVRQSSKYASETANKIKSANLSSVLLAMISLVGWTF